MISKLLKEAASIVASATTRPKLALVVRGDLKMSKGKTAAQCAHAAVMCYQQSNDAGSVSQRRQLQAWCRTGQAKIVLRVDTYANMLALQAEAQRAGVMAALVQDAGHTQLEPGTATVLGVGPDAPEAIDKLVRHLKLL